MSSIPHGDFKYDVFLAHSGGDAALVEALARRLRREGLRPFYSRWHLIPGELWQEKLEEAIGQSATVAICFGPAARAPWRDLEMQLAQDHATKYPDWRVIPILLEGARPESVSGFLGLRTWIDLRAGLADAAAVERLVAGIQGRPVEPEADPAPLVVERPQQLHAAEPRSINVHPRRRLELAIARSSKRVWTVAVLGLVVALLAGGRHLYEWVQRERCNFGDDVEAARMCYLVKAVHAGSRAAELAGSGTSRGKVRADSLLKKALQYGKCADSLRLVANELGRQVDFSDEARALQASSLKNNSGLRHRIIPQILPPFPLLTVEALNARYGSGLIVHYGNPEDPHFMLVDGGPAGTYELVLKPRLEAIRQRWAPRAWLPLDLVVGTHGDRAHLAGLQELIEDQSRRADGTRLYDIRDLWYNDFAAHGRARADAGGASDLPKLAARLGIRQNDPWSPLVMAPPSGAAEIELGDAMSVVVVAPQWERVRDLYATSSAAAINRSSIVLMLEALGSRVLLTGDADTNDILQGLERAGYLRSGHTLRVDLLELPFEGNAGAVTPDFFRRVTAEHYLVNGNGLHDNPSLETLQMLLDAREGERCTIHFVVGDGDHDLRMRLEAFFAAVKRSGKRSCEARYREPDEPSIRIDLLAKVDY